MTAPLKIAYFITPHGFGHASRASAVMSALQKELSQCRFVLFTTVPKTFFSQSGLSQLEYHTLDSDVGMVQYSPLEENLSGTCDRLDRMLPYDDALTDHLARQLNRIGCSIVICDIAAIGIVSAAKAGLPSVLVENFTWDWIYAACAHQESRFEPHQAYLSEIYDQADHHIQTEPLCHRGNATLAVGPISREPRTPAEIIRTQLGITSTDTMVLVSMGGVADQFLFLDRLPEKLDFHLVVPGSAGIETARDQVTLLPTHSSFYHPDLMAAADVLIGKAGYSTIAEAYLCGIPFGYVKRARSPESAALETFIARHLPSQAISEKDYASGKWIKGVMHLLKRSRPSGDGKNHAVEVARYVKNLLCS